MRGAAPAVATRFWPGDGRPIVCAHATGFCKDVWEPVVAELRAKGVGHPVVAFDQRGHGDSPPPEPVDWWQIGHDALAVAQSVGDPVLGIGHSSGGAALLMAELLAPATFPSLLLVEPIVFPGSVERRDENPMSATALRRRATFASPEEALDNFRGKGPFAAWDERALRAYVFGGLELRDGAWRLKCRPEVEAAYYATASLHGVWERLPEVATPALLVAGAGSTSHPAEFIAAQASRLGNGTSAVIPAASHLVPMERPEVIAEMAAGLLQGTERP